MLRFLRISKIFFDSMYSPMFNNDEESQIELPLFVEDNNQCCIIKRIILFFYKKLN
jgi:hypothetical protein